MPRGPRLDAAGLVYHVICRGIERREIFSDNADYCHFLDRLSKLADDKNFQIYAFALMPNHFHLLLRPLKMSLAILMRRLLTSYALYFNRRHKRNGHLFQNRYKSFIVEEERYLLELIRYIHLNPLRAGLVDDLKALSHWPYSGHSALMGNIRLSWFEVDENLALFAERRATARRKLTQFMADGIVMGRRPDLVGGGLKRSMANSHLLKDEKRLAYDERILGSGGFVEAVLKELSKPASFVKCSVSLEQVLESVALCYGLTISELCSGSRRAVVIKARASVVWLVTKQLTLPASILAQVLGVSDSAIHSIIISGRGELESQNIQLGCQD